MIKSLKYNRVKMAKKNVHKNNDIFSPKKRSQIMSAVKAKNTMLEKKFFKLLRKEGLRFQTHYSKVIGKPDIAFPSKKLLIFIDSNFWHGWQYPKWKRKLTSDFWKNKIEQNRKRDKEVTRKLRKNGWTVLRFWEHQIKKDPEKLLNKISQLAQKK